MSRCYKTPERTALADVALTRECYLDSICVKPSFEDARIFWLFLELTVTSDWILCESASQVSLYMTVVACVERSPSLQRGWRCWRTRVCLRAPLAHVLGTQPAMRTSQPPNALRKRQFQVYFDFLAYFRACRGLIVRCCEHRPLAALAPSPRSSGNSEPCTAGSSAVDVSMQNMKLFYSSPALFASRFTVLCKSLCTNALASASRCQICSQRRPLIFSWCTCLCR